MAEQHFFDIISKVDIQEVKNAIQQALKEISQRYDLKNSKSSIELNEKDLQIMVTSEDDFKLKVVIDILQTKFVKRSVSLKALKYGKVEPSAGATVKQEIKLQQGIDKENAKLITKLVKDSGLKVQAQIQNDQIRVSGKNKDDLQAIIKLIREKDFPFDTQFTNYR
jgi:uncharacterized protein YajQ (UPF0234 family)